MPSNHHKLSGRMILMAIASVLILTQPVTASLRVKPSGIRGRSVWRYCGWLPIDQQFPLPGPRLFGCTNRPYATTIYVTGLSHTHWSSIRTDSAGFFELRLRPGRYRLKPKVCHLCDASGNIAAVAFGPGQQVHVSRGQMTNVRLRYSIADPQLFQARPVTQAPPRFTVADLGTLPGSRETRVKSINNHGHVVGATVIPFTFGPPFVYRNGSIAPIPGFPINTYAANINDSGAIVLRSEPQQAFLYQDGIVTDLNSLAGADWIIPKAINNSGQITGTTPGTNSVWTAFVLDGLGMRFLGTLPGADTSGAEDINEAGQAAGYSCFFDASVCRATLFQNGDALDLGTLGEGEIGMAQAINDSGLAVGWSGPRAFAYFRGKMFDLGVLPGCNVSSAWDVNNSGWIVGACEEQQEGVIGLPRAFLYANCQLYSLDDLVPADSGWKLASAETVNDRGQIAGWGFLNGNARAFVVTPVRALQPPAF